MVMFDAQGAYWCALDQIGVGMFLTAWIGAFGALGLGVVRWLAAIACGAQRCHRAVSPAMMERDAPDEGEE